MPTNLLLTTLGPGAVTSKCVQKQTRQPTVGLAYKMHENENRFKIDWLRELAVRVCQEPPLFLCNNQDNAGQRLAKAAKATDDSSNSSDSGSTLTLLAKEQAPVSRCSLSLKVDAFSGSSFPTGSTQGSCHSVPQCASISHPGYMSSPTLSTAAASTSPGVDHCLLPLPHLTVYSAMYTNGRMLGIPCVTSLEAKSAVAPPEIPLALQPIPTQLNIVHFLFIDRFPLARLRHNMIMLSDNFSSEEFIADLFTMPSFTITSGYHCWDPKGWVVDPEFKLKWEFLFR